MDVKPGKTFDVNLNLEVMMSDGVGRTWGLLKERPMRLAHLNGLIDDFTIHLFSG